MRYSPFLSCREAAKLIGAALDRELGPVERVALAVHLRICNACPKVVRQYEQMRRSMREWRDGLENAVDDAVGS